MDNDAEFLGSVLNFGRWVTFATGSISAIACGASWYESNTTTAVLYMVGAFGLLAVSFFLRSKRKALSLIEANAGE